MKAPNTPTPLDPKPGLVDAIGALQDALSRALPQVRQLESLRKQLRGHFSSQPADLAFSVVGKQYVATIGPRGMEREIDNKKLAVIIGQKRFMELASVSIKSVEPIMGTLEIERLLILTQSGPRTLAVAGKTALAIAA